MIEPVSLIVLSTGFVIARAVGIYLDGQDARDPVEKPVVFGPPIASADLFYGPENAPEGYSEGYEPDHDRYLPSYLPESGKSTKHVDPACVSFLEGLDEDLCTDEEIITIPRVAGRWARRARMELHIIDHDLATEMMVKDWLKAGMKSEDYRESVIATVLPYAVQYSFLPTRTEVDARNETMSCGYRERYSMREPLWKFSPGWDQWSKMPYLFKAETRPSRT
jgi:hypothetical protein